MSRLVKFTPEEEKEFIRKAKQYQRVKLLIIISSVILALIAGVIVVSNGKIFKLFGVQNYGEGLNIFFMLIYIFIIFGIFFFLALLTIAAVRGIVEFVKDKFLRK